MPRQVQVVLPTKGRPASFDPDMLKRYLTQDVDVMGLARLDGMKPHAQDLSTGVDCTVYIFRSINKKVGRIVSNLERLGVGHSYGVIDVLQLQTTKPRLVNRKKKRFRLAFKLPN